MNYESYLDFPDTQEMFIRFNGKLVYLSYKMNNSLEYKTFLIEKTLNG